MGARPEQLSSEEQSGGGSGTAENCGAHPRGEHHSSPRTLCLRVHLVQRRMPCSGRSTSLLPQGALLHRAEKTAQPPVSKPRPGAITVCTRACGPQTETARGPSHPGSQRCQDPASMGGEGPCPQAAPATLQGSGPFKHVSPLLNKGVVLTPPLVGICQERRQIRQRETFLLRLWAKGCFLSQFSSFPKINVFSSGELVSSVCALHGVGKVPALASRRDGTWREVDSSKRPAYPHPCPSVNFVSIIASLQKQTKAFRTCKDEGIV